MLIPVGDRHKKSQTNQKDVWVKAPSKSVSSCEETMSMQTERAASWQESPSTERTLISVLNWMSIPNCGTPSKARSAANQKLPLNWMDLCLIWSHQFVRCTSICQDMKLSQPRNSVMPLWGLFRKTRRS